MIATEEHIAVEAKPRLGFAGVGWIGRHRMEALIESGLIKAAAFADPNAAQAKKAAQMAPGAKQYGGLETLLEADLDGVVIATPSALHAEQAERALEAGLSVFCQKPLGRTAAETRRVVSAARQADRLLAVDLSYRFTEGMKRIRRLVQDGAIGDVYAVHLVFHNAYGPDKDWFYDPEQSGGGCVMDLGVHLVDLALWTLDFPDVTHVRSRLFVEGRPLATPSERVEDYATACLDLDTGATVNLACSWNLPAGQDAVIEAAFYGTQGGLSFRNVDGSFYDFQAALLEGTTTEVLAAPPDAWGGRAAVNWARQLAANRQYDETAESLIEVAGALDAIYNRSEQAGDSR